MKQINIVTVDGYFGQSIPTETSLNVELIGNKLKEFGFIVDVIDIETFANDGVDSSAFYLIGSHQNKAVKKYIDGVLSVTCSLKNTNLIPRVELILAHENKGLQNIIARELSLPLISQVYKLSSEFSSRRTPSKTVVKLIDGSGSDGVFIAPAELNLFDSLVRRSFRELSLNNVIYLVKEKIKSKIFRGLINEGIKKYFGLKIPYVEQEFIKNLTFDYKVLVFFNSVFVLKRSTRKNDFRASGSGIFEFVDASNELLDYSLNFRKKLSCPYVSIDIVWDAEKNEYRVVEFQCVHFGPYTQMNSPYYYMMSDEGHWNKIENDTQIEILIADSVVRYLNNEKNCVVRA